MKIIYLFCQYNEHVHETIVAGTKRPVNVCGIFCHFVLSCWLKLPVELTLLGMVAVILHLLSGTQGLLLEHTQVLH